MRKQSTALMVDAAGTEQGGSALKNASQCKSRQKPCGSFAALFDSDLEVS